MAEVTAKIKIRTALPSGKTVLSDDYYLEEGEMYIAGTGTNEISIYIGAKNGSSLIPISGIKPIVLTKTNQGNYEPKTIGGFTNNGTSLSGAQLTTDLLILGSGSVGNQLPNPAEDPPADGQIFFLVQ